MARRNLIEETAARAEKNARLRAEAEAFAAANIKPEEAEMTTPKTTKPVASKTTKTVKPAAKTPKAKPMCGCGCGARTGGGTFCPGHDAKLKSQLFAIARGDDKDAAAVALAQLDKLGWTWLMAKAKPVTKKLTKTEVAWTEEDDSLWTGLLDSLGGLTI